MRETLLALYELQKIDKASYALTQQAEEIPLQIHELEQSLEGFRSELGVLNTEIEGLRGEQREIEAKNAEEGEKHRKWKTRLNDIKSPREYQALSREVELGERQIHDSEERIFELMTNIEAKQATIDTKTKTLKGGEKEVRAKIKVLRDRQSALSVDAEAASQGREVEIKKINPRLIKRYDNVRAKRSGTAVVLTEKNACSGCNMAIRPQQLVEMQRFTSIEQCAMCHRIMVHESLLKTKAEAEE